MLSSCQTRKPPLLFTCASPISFRESCKLSESYFFGPFLSPPLGQRCARGDWHALTPLMPPIKQVTGKAEFYLTREAEAQGQRGKQNEGCALGCCSPVREPAEERRPTGISGTEVQHLCRGGTCICPGGSVARLFGTHGIQFSWFPYLPKVGDSGFVARVWMLEGDFANSGCDLREACSSQLHSCRKKHEELICLCLTRITFTPDQPSFAGQAILLMLLASR